MVSRITLTIETQEAGLIGDLDCAIGNYFYGGTDPQVFCEWEKMRAADRELILRSMETIRRVHANLKRRIIRESELVTGCCHLSGDGWTEADTEDRRSEERSTPLAA